MSEKLYQQANPQGGAQAGPDMGGQNGGAQTGPTVSSITMLTTRSWMTTRTTRSNMKPIDAAGTVYTAPDCGVFRERSLWLKINEIITRCSAFPRALRKKRSKKHTKSSHASITPT